MVGKLMADGEDPLDDVIGMPSTLTTTEPTGALAGLQTSPERHISTVNRQRINLRLGASQSCRSQHQLERARRNHADEANPHATPNTPLLPKEWS
ncbi:MAG: hypothetical protein JOZ09_03825 [Pseudonocardiales bacterium]|jgi:hypothetical protein|nr:hypothetical protein [Pseudonocardiales bacterium]